MTLLPFIRWVGGKRKQAIDLVSRVTANLDPAGRYIEPFLGGGAVALAMPTGTPMVLGDACKPLGYLWWWLKQEPEAMAEYAAGFGTKLDDGWNTAEGYAAARFDHNVEPFSDDEWQPSARFMWILHACFNGIYRENGQGYFNVPWGKRKTLAIPAPETLRAIADHLVNAEVYPGCDAETLIDTAGHGDVIFNDPPYDTAEDSFTSYTAKKFGADDQKRLRDASERAIDRGATVIVTNSDTPRIRDLYRGVWVVEAVLEDRPVAASADARQPAPCVIAVGRR